MPSLDNMMLRQIIMDHYDYPRNKELTDNEGYMSRHMASDSCIDDITVQTKISDGKIDDIRFDGVACTISTASTSIMSELLKGKTTEEAKEIIKTFIEMIKRETTDEEQLKKLEDAIAFRNVSNMPARVKCALLAWHTLEDMLNKEVEKGSGNIDCCH